MIEHIYINKMRDSGRILAKTLNYLRDEVVVPGISTLFVSEKAEEFIRSHKGAVPAFKGYRGFPGAACVSVNTEAVHTVPKKDVVLKDGDIVSIDCGVLLEEHYSDACRTIAVGEIDSRTRKLVKVTEQALNKGIEAAVAGSKIGDISFSVQRHIERNRFNVSLELVGHGIGKVLHGPPCVPNYGPPATGETLVEGQCLAIEPVVFDGSAEVQLGTDNWTLSSPHGALSAHFEDTIVVREGEAEILTRIDND